MDAQGQFDGLDAYHQQAFQMIGSAAARNAFDLDREPAQVREAYGPHLFGQGCLLARRLLEAGVLLTTVYWHYEGPDDSPVWDTHENNFRHLRERLAPPTDQAVSALLDDLSQRGLLDDTLVICMGEFGRSPKINAKAGRDHWPGVQSILLAGAGLPGGAVYGASDQHGGYPAENAVAPPDLFATFLHLLGIQPHAQLQDYQGRPIRATRGRPIEGLLA
jgi:arylsulfatase A-like enzyme